MEEKIKQMERWIEQSKQGDVSGFFAISIDKEGFINCMSECTVHQLITMLGSACEENPLFQAILQAFAKNLKQKEGGNQ